MRILNEIEKRIESQLRRLFGDSASSHPEILEVQRGIIEDVLSRIEHLPRARVLFPFSSIDVKIGLPAADRRRTYEAVFCEGEPLTRDIRAALQEERCEFPSDLHIEVHLRTGMEKPFAVTCGQARKQHTQPAPAQTSSLTLVVLSGKTGQESYTFEKERIHLGRMTEVLDSNKRPVRRNDVVFEESADPPNSTVSRAHAHLRFDRQSMRYRIYDDGSAYGTSVLHGGQLVNVPKGSGRGVAIAPGDEIFLGQARLKVE